MMNLLLSALVLWPLLSPEQQDKNAATLQREGLRKETIDKDPIKARDLYQQSVEKAKAEGRNEIAAQSLFWYARCCEAMEEVDAAQQAYEEIASSFSGQVKVAEAAAEKRKRRGVDVWIRKFRTAVAQWRDSGGNVGRALEEQKESLNGKISALGADAVYGLIQAGLSDEDDVVRGFAADRLSELADESAIAEIISALNAPSRSLQAGASLALERIADKVRKAAELDRQAADLMAALEMQLPPDLSAEVTARRDETRRQSEELGQKAAAIRNRIPASLNVQPVQSALAALLGNESISSGPRREAARALGAFGGEVSADLAAALLTALSSSDRNVRAAACWGSGQVRFSPDDARRIIDRLAGSAAQPGIVMMEPEKDSRPHEERDWANDALARASAAEALGKLGYIRAAPALIEALEDTNASVREAANRALVTLTGVDQKYDANAPLSKRDEKMPDRPTRQESTQAWVKWWEETSGVDTLVERFHQFVAGWKQASIELLFDRDLYLRDVLARQQDAAENSDAVQRAETTLQFFESRKAEHVQAVVDLGDAALQRLSRYLGGENLLYSDAPNAAVRAFVAEATARLLAASGDSSQLERLSDLVLSGTSSAQRAGAAMVLGLQPRDRISASTREILERKGLTHADVEVKTASADALGRVGDANSSSALSAAALAADVSQEPLKHFAATAYRSIGRIGSADATVVEAIAKILPDGRNQRENPDFCRQAAVRERVAEALGRVANPVALEALLRARQDMAPQVRRAAAEAIRNLHSKDPSVRAKAESVLTDSTDAYDRLGAALSLGDMGDPASALLLVHRVVDRNALRGETRDPVAGVRAAACTALGKLMPKNRTVMEKLIQGLKDDIEEVRESAYQAVRATAGAEVAEKKKLSVTVVGADGGRSKEDSEYRAGLLPEERDRFIQIWMDWARDLPDST